MSNDIWRDNMERIDNKVIEQPLSRKYYLYYKLPDLEYQVLAELSKIDTTLLEIFGTYSDEYDKRKELCMKIKEEIKQLCEL